MKNKKKNWRHILLRGSALMAAVLMCFAGSFPVFAAEDPVEPGGSVDVLEGEWTFKEVLSVPPFLQPDPLPASYDIDFTVNRFIPSSFIEELNSQLLEAGYDQQIPVTDYTVVFNCTGFEIFSLFTGDQVNYFIFDYVCSSFSVFPSSDLVVQYLSFAGYPDQLGNETYHSEGFGWGGSSYDWVRTVDFGTGAAIESPEFYAWFTSNAIPHRDMWTLTERLQAVAASIWSVIVTISSTIVSNPLLLFTSGFLFLGGCIAIFSRLLARR